MTTRTKVIIAIVVMLTSFAVGRYTTPTKTITVTKTEYVEKKTDDKKTDDSKDAKTTTTTTTKPDGTKIITVIVERRTDDRSEDKSTQETDKTSEQDKTTITGGNKKITVSALAALKMNDFTGGFIYGTQVQQQVLGPISVGAFVLTNSTAGVSLGLQF